MTRDADRWTLDQMHDRLGEIAHRAAVSGPQRIELPSGDALIVKHEPARPVAPRSGTGADLIAAMQACPYPDVELDPKAIFDQRPDVIDHLLASPPWDDAFAEDVAVRPKGPGRIIDL